MKKLLVGILIVIGLSVSAQAYDVSANTLKKHCQYRVYGNGVSMDEIDSYMIGVINGISYMVVFENRSDLLLKGEFSSYDDIIDVGCKEALANNDASINFDSKFKFGITIILDKRYAKQSKLK